MLNERSQSPEAVCCKIYFYDILEKTKTSGTVIANGWDGRVGWQRGGSKIFLEEMGLFCILIVVI